MKILVSLEKYGDLLGYDLKITDTEATVQDYIDALNRFQEQNIAPCLGCDNCCYERIPLTYADVQNYLKGLFPDLTLLDFVEQFCEVQIIGKSIDIILRRFADDACPFLDQKEKRCLHHQWRSFVCQTYICLPYSEKAGKLRDFLLNQGEDALVAHYLADLKNLKNQKEFAGNNIIDLASEYKNNPTFDKKCYTDIFLKDILPANLWLKLYSKQADAPDY